jgi:hypothetical protein
MSKCNVLIGVAGFAVAVSPVMGQVAADAAPPVKEEYPAPATGLLDVLGDVVAGPYDVEAATGDNRILGVEVAWDHLWVSGSGNSAAPSPQAGRIYKFSLTGTLVATYNQVTNSPATAYWHGRDGASDEANNLLYFGAESGELTEYTYNPTTGGVTYSRTIWLPLASAVRALVRNPNNGHFFTIDFSGPVYEFTIDPPTIVNTFSGLGLSVYGAAWDTVNNTMWVWSQNGPAGNPANQRVRATEYNPATMQPTGRSFHGVVHPPTAPSTQNNIAGGADIMCNHPANPGRLSLVTVHQGTPDAVFIYDLEAPCGACYANCDGSTTPPILNVEDFTCFINQFAAASQLPPSQQLTHYANCDQSTTPPVLNVEDFTCFINAFAAGCP